MREDNWQKKAGLKLQNMASERGMTQEDIAREGHISQAWVSQIFNGKFKRVSGTVIEGMSRALKVNPETVQAIVLGREYDEPRYIDNPMLHLERLRRSIPITIPIYDDFPFTHGGMMTPKDFEYISPAEGLDPRRNEAYIVHTDCFAPIIKPKDRIVVDVTIQKEDFKEGDLIVCNSLDTPEWIGVYRMVEDNAWIFSAHDKVKCSDCLTAYKIVRRITHYD